MTKLIDNVVKDIALNYIKDNATSLVTCTAAPADYAEALTLATATRIISASDFSVPATVLEKREMVLDEQIDMSITVEAVITHIALLDVANTQLLLTNTLVEPYSGCVGRLLSLAATTIALGKET